MNVKVIPSDYIKELECRLSARPHLSEARLSKKILESLNSEKLCDLTLNKKRGVFNGPRFARQWVDSLENGRYLLSGSDIVAFDYTYTSIISENQVQKMPEMILSEGTSLITSYGTIGNTAYVRKDMVGCVGSDNVMKVIPNQSKILSGYLYAFLASKYGVRLATVGATGGTVPFLPPNRLWDIPVPRFDKVQEEHIDYLINVASLKKAKYLEKLKVCNDLFEKFVNFGRYQEGEGSTINTNVVSSKSIYSCNRLDASYHSISGQKASEIMREANGEAVKKLNQVAKVFTPGIFKRPYVDDPSYGYPYLSGSEIFQSSPKPRGYLKKTAPNIEKYIIKKNWLLIQDAGQVGGLIGRVIRVGEESNNSVASNHLMRIVPENDVDAAYLYVLLSSKVGYDVIVRNSFGTSIPQLSPEHVGEIAIPWPDRTKRKELAFVFLKTWEERDEAIKIEKQAVKLVEDAIEAAAPKH